MSYQNKVEIGLEFEFYSKIPTDQLYETLERTLKKKIKFFNEGHSDFTPEKGVWKLERDYSGGQDMFELVTEPLEYDEYLYYMDKIFSLIGRVGYTTDKCAFQPNISMKDKTKMNQFNKVKFALNVDEDSIFLDFPEREGNIYCKSIKHFIPITKHFRYTDKIDPNNFIVPESKYYGVDFTKLKKNYLEIRYFGGKNYEKYFPKFKTYIDDFISNMIRSTDGLFTKSDEAKLLKYVKNHQRVLEAYKSYEKFRYAYPSIEIWVNLIKTPSVVEMHYHMIKDKIFEILTEAKIKKAIINYNSDYSSIEIKDGEFNKIYKLENVVVINGQVSGDIINCRLFDSKVDNAHLQACQIYRGTKISESKLNDCYVSSGSEVYDSYIAGGKFSIILSNLVNCIFRSGRISKDAFKKAINTEFIEYKYI
jgi:hypothetical protein